MYTHTHPVSFNLIVVDNADKCVDFNCFIICIYYKVIYEMSKNL